jgi:hypothetical protein
VENASAGRKDFSISDSWCHIEQYIHVEEKVTDDKLQLAEI